MGRLFTYGFPKLEVSPGVCYCRCQDVGWVFIAVAAPRSHALLPAKVHLNSAHGRAGWVRHDPGEMARM